MARVTRRPGHRRVLKVCCLVVLVIAPAACSRSNTEQRVKKESAQEVIAHVIAAAGGAETFMSMDTLEISSEGSRQISDGTDARVSVVTKIAFPDRFRFESTFGFGQVTTLIVPQGIFLTTPAGTEQLPTEEGAAIANSRLQNQAVLLRHLAQAGLQTKGAGTDRVGGRSVSLIRVTVEGLSIALFVDTNLDRIVRLEYDDPSDPKKKVAVSYSDFRKSGELHLPFKSEGSVAGSVMSISEVKVLKTNVAFDDSLFVPPPPG